MMIYEKERISGGLTLTVQEMVKPNAQADALPHGEPRRVDPVEGEEAESKASPRSVHGHYDGSSGIFLLIPYIFSLK